MRRFFIVILALFACGLSAPAWASTNEPQKRIALFSQVRKDRIDEIRKMIPKEPRGFGVPITDRASWDKAASQIDLPALMKRAEKVLDTPMPPWSDSLYLDMLRTKNRAPGERMMIARVARLNPVVWAECFENKGRFIPVIEETLLGLISHPSWTRPAHDQKLTNFYGTQYTTDLPSSAMAHTMAQALYFLGDRIDPKVRRQVMDQLHLKVFDNVKYIIETGEKGINSWIFATNNWNSVCFSGVLGAALSVIEDPKERAYYIAAAEYYGQNAVRGFEDDGYCSEGVGYFNYGFEHFIYLRELLWQHTGGGIDLFADEKIRKIAQFPNNIHIINNVYPAFADCSLKAKPSEFAKWYCGRAIGEDTGGAEYSVKIPGEMDHDGLLLFPNSVTQADNAPSGKHVTPLYSYFDVAGVAVFRPAKGDASFGVAVKGGSNAENHNHNDLGSYFIVVGDQFMAGDPGISHPYYSDMGNKNLRYTKYKTPSSFGHPVPVYAGTFQHYGPQCRAEVVSADFTPARDSYVIDIRSAYPDAPGLEKAVRTFVYTRGKKMHFEVKDEFAFAEPQEVESTVTSISDWKQTGRDRIEFTRNGQKMLAVIEAGGEDFVIESGTFKENTPLIHRISIKLKNKVKSGTISVVYRPLT